MSALDELMEKVIKNSKTHYAVVDGDTMEGAAWELAQLREEIAEIHEERVKVLNEQCAPDELHCVCVPTLRAELKQLRADLAAAVSTLRAVRADRPSAHSDKVWQMVNEMIARLEGGDK